MTLHTCIEFFGFLGISLLAYNDEDYEIFLLLLGQVLYPIVTLLNIYPSRKLLERNYYVVYLLNLYFNDIIPNMLYLLSAIIVTK